MMYGVEVHAMAKCWDLIDAQCDALELPRMPTGNEYRHDNIGEIRTVIIKPH
jgi:hypothetical protein